MFNFRGWDIFWSNHGLETKRPQSTSYWQKNAQSTICHTTTWDEPVVIKWGCNLVQVLKWTKQDFLDSCWTHSAGKADATPVAPSGEKGQCKQEWRVLCESLLVPDSVSVYWFSWTHIQYLFTGCVGAYIVLADGRYFNGPHTIQVSASFCSTCIIAMFRWIDNAK